MCSRVTYIGPAGSVVTGRTMDWFMSLQIAAWSLPTGTPREGGSTQKPFRWTSQFGSVVTTAYDGIAFDGLNTAGLAANLLYLPCSEYGPRDPSRPGMSVAAWVQYVLDSFATVADAGATLQHEPFQVVGINVPGDVPPTAHISISDATGDSAICEYIDGKLVIHHGRQYQVMTNEPTFDKQLALAEYWMELDGQMLPGTGRATDRFVRASWYLANARATDDEVASVATVMSIIRNVSVPMLDGFDPEHPNLSSTIFRVASDHTRLRFFVELADSPNVFWIDLAELTFDAGSAVRRLEIDGGPVRSGETSALFQEQAGPYAFVGECEQPSRPVTT